MIPPLSAERPHSPGAVQECVRQALRDHTPLELRGGGTKWRLGRRLEGLRPLELGGLDRLLSYEPEELILVVQPGMSLAAVEELLAGRNQHLAFEPPHFGAGATVGGTVACNLSGPRRFKAGALRDFILGIEMVEGHGERIRAGGKVVKNVTGYDLSKVLSGSFGTLGPLTEICFKVWPRPEAQKTLALHGQALAQALELLVHLAALPAEITGLAYCPASEDEKARTLVRLEGPQPALEAQTEKLSEEIRGEISTMEEEESAAFWRSWREVESFQPAPGEELWRFVQPPAAAAALVERLKAHHLLRCALDWAGGLLWALFPTGAAASSLHQSALEHQATAWRFAAAGDPNEEAFTPLAPGLARLNRQLERAFDPRDLFNPGRIHPRERAR